MSPDVVSPADLHWLAGLIEGEGSFMPGPPSNPRMPIISLSMVDADVIARAARLLGPKAQAIDRGNPRWQTTYQLRVRGSGAVAWMRVLQPLLGERRRAQIDRALACYEPRSRTRLDDEAATGALDALAGGSSVRAVADALGVSVWCIYDLRGGRTHRHVRRPDAEAPASGGPAQRVSPSSELRSSSASP